jgi:hypothetical protein
MSGTASSKENIVRQLAEKAVIKLDVVRQTEEAFALIRITLEKLQRELTVDLAAIDKRIHIKYIEKGPFDLELNFSDDILIFSLHPEVFNFDEGHPVKKSSYLSKDPTRGFCGMIMIYNFLTDSFKYNRTADTGCLIARLFVNREGHFFVEGKRQMGFLFNDLSEGIINAETIRQVVEAAILHSIQFDIYTPAFDQMKVITVQEVLDKSMSGLISTGKRLGFKFQSDTERME